MHWRHFSGGLDDNTSIKRPPAHEAKDEKRKKDSPETLSTGVRLR
jgi:hypothetical protein